LKKRQIITVGKEYVIVSQFGVLDAIIEEETISLGGQRISLEA
jgi:hypothetical protein